MKLLKTALIGSGMALAMTVAANAATITYVSGVNAVNAAGNTATTLPTGVDTPAWDTPAGPSVRAPGSTPGVARSPYEDVNAAFTTQGYFSVGPGSATLSSTLYFTGLQKELSLLWGSVDDYNSIELCNGAVCELINYIDLAGLPGFDFAVSAVYVTISGVLFDSIKFSSPSQAALEWSAMTTVANAEVPLPLSVVLLGSGLLGLGFLGRRQKKAATA